MKKIKFLTLLLSVVLVMSTILTACGQNNSSSDLNGGGGNEAKNPLKEEENKYAYIDGTLHDVNVDFDLPVSDFVVNGNCEYTIVQTTEQAKDASAFVLSRISEATGALVLKTPTESANITKDSKYIVFGADLSKYGLTMPSYETLNASGYRIQNYGKNVFINAYAERGYQMGCLAFLRAVLGYDMFSEDLVVYERDGAIMPSLDITEKPDYDYVTDSNQLSTEASYGMGYTRNTSIFMNPGNDGYRWVHNVLDFVTGGNGNGDMYNTSEELKAVRNDPEKKKWLSDEGNQVCFTAHGDIEAYEKMVDEFVKNAKSFISKKENRNRDTLLISAMDSYVGQTTESRCTCDACKASWDYYGGTTAGSHLKLVNNVAERINEWLASDETVEEFGEKRIVYIGFLCYSASINAPVGVDAEGNVSLKKECSFILDESNGEVVTVESENDLKCGENVILFYAASGANYTKTFYDSANERFCNAITRWSALGDYLYVWAYENNYHSYLYPYNSWDSAFDSMRFWKSLGARYIYWEGTWENANNPSFSKLSDYLDAKCAFDVNSDYQMLVERFFENYFGEGAEYMYTYFSQVQAHLKSIEDKTGNGNIQSDNLAEKSNWPIGLINGWIDLIEKAERAIGANIGIDDERYEVLSKHLLIESLFPRFVLCNSYEDMYDDETLLAMRKQFAADFASLNSGASATHQEHYTFDVILKEWGLK